MGFVELCLEVLRNDEIVNGDGCFSTVSDEDDEDEEASDLLR